MYVYTCVVGWLISANSLQLRIQSFLDAIHRLCLYKYYSALLSLVLIGPATSPWTRGYRDGATTIIPASTTKYYRPLMATRVHMYNQPRPGKPDVAAVAFPECFP